MLGGRDIFQQTSYCFVLFCVEEFLIPISNRSQEGKGGYALRKEVLLIGIGGYSEGCE